MKYNLIIFDCDGTLVDSESLINKAFSEVMIEDGFAEFTYEFCLSNFLGKTYVDIFKFVKNKHPYINMAEIEERFILKANQLMPKELTAMPNAYELLDSLSGTAKCVASNGEYPIVKYSLELAHLDEFFNQDEIFTYEMVAAGKPEPDLFLYAAKKMSVGPSKCLVIEDSIIGATAAHKAGMDFIVYFPNNETHNPGKLSELNALKPLAIVQDLLEVKRFLK